MNRALIVFVLIGCVGCAARPLKPGAERVLLSNDRPTGDCQLLGEVIGGQGNPWTAELTSTRNLLEGSRNDLRNRAHAMGATHVHTQQTLKEDSYAIAGNAYKCH